MKKIVLAIKALFFIGLLLGCSKGGDPTKATSIDEAVEKWQFQDFYTAIESICMGDYKDSGEACMLAMLSVDPQADIEYTKRVTQRGCDLKGPTVGVIEYEGPNGPALFWTPKSCKNLYTWFGSNLFESGQNYNYNLEEGIKLLKDIQGINIPVYKTKRELVELQVKEADKWH